MVKRVPAVTSTGAFTGKVLEWLDTRYGGSGPVTGDPVKVAAVTTAGAFRGQTLTWLDNRYNGSGTVSGTANRLPSVTTSGAFTGKVLSWLDSRYAQAVVDPESQYELPTFTHTVDPRTYMSGGQTWTNTDIRSAFQAALNQAHSYAFASANNRVKFIIPPGIGQILSTVGTAPINYYSETAGRRLSNRMGFGLRPNMPGKVVFVGEGGRTEKSTIQLSSNARCLFYANTDAGTSGGTFADYTWVKDAAYSNFAGNRGNRPDDIMCFQNYDFVGFCVSNEDAKNEGTNIISNAHTVFGASPDDIDWRQVYLSFYNLNHSDIKVKGFDKTPTQTELETRRQIPFSYLTRHLRGHEANNGAAGRNVWGNWDLNTLAGRRAAYNARWTFAHKLNFYDVEVVDAGRAILVTADRTSNPASATSQYFDEVNLYRCTHVQENPYNYKTPHTSFFLGAGGMGGTARAIDCLSTNVGDNPIEMGAFHTRIIKNFTSNDCRLPGILFTNTQIPPNHATSSCLVDGYTFNVTATGMATEPISRPFEFDTEADGLGTPINNVTIRNATMTIDGGSSKRSIRSLVERTDRYGWAFIGEIGKLDIDGLNLVIRNVTTEGGDTAAGGANNAALLKTVPLVYYRPAKSTEDSTFDISQTECTMKNITLSIRDWVVVPTVPGTPKVGNTEATKGTAPIPYRVIGVLPITSGTFTLENLTLNINNIAGVPTIDAVAIGGLQAEWSRRNASGTGTRPEFFYLPIPSSFPHTHKGENSRYQAPGGTYSITDVKGTRTGTNQPATRRLLVVQKQNPIASHTYGSIDATGWGTGYANLSSDTVPRQTYTVVDATETAPEKYYWTNRNNPVTVTS